MRICRIVQWKKLLMTEKSASPLVDPKSRRDEFNPSLLEGLGAGAQRKKGSHCLQAVRTF